MPVLAPPPLWNLGYLRRPTLVFYSIIESSRLLGWDIKSAQAVLVHRRTGYQTPHRSGHLLGLDGCEDQGCKSTCAELPNEGYASAKGNTQLDPLKRGNVQGLLRQRYCQGLAVGRKGGKRLQVRKQTHHRLGGYQSANLITEPARDKYDRMYGHLHPCPIT